MQRRPPPFFLPPGRGDYQGEVWAGQRPPAARRGGAAGARGRGGIAVRSYVNLVRHPGNAALFRAAEMSIVAILNGYPLHLHGEGVRGTGKTTILRAARAILPRIERVHGCPYNCLPGRPHCPLHRGLAPAEVQALGREWVTMPFLEVSPSAKVGTVAGSIDLTRITDPANPQVALLPGTIPQAHRGIIFVDEINRLADVAPELADVLLDVMGTRPGRIQIEETGLPRVELPVSVAIWAASNPDEEPGPLDEIRRQLSDRFDLVVPVRRPARRELVETILAMAEKVGGPEEPESSGKPAEAAGVAQAAGAAHAEARRSAELEACRGRLPETTMPAALRALLASLYVEFSLESLRAVEGLQNGARLAALLEGRSAAGIDDVLFVAPLVLEHRVDPQLLPKILRFLECWKEEQAQRGSGVPGGSRARGDGEAAAGHGAASSGRGTGATGTPAGEPAAMEPAGGDGPAAAKRQPAATTAPAATATPAAAATSAPPAAQPRKGGLWRGFFDRLRSMLGARPAPRGAGAGAGAGRPGRGGGRAGSGAGSGAGSRSGPGVDRGAGAAAGASGAGTGGAGTGGAEASGASGAAGAGAAGATGATGTVGAPGATGASVSPGAGGSSGARGPSGAAGRGGGTGAGEPPATAPPGSLQPAGGPGRGAGGQQGPGGATGPAQSPANLPVLAPPHRAKSLAELAGRADLVTGGESAAGPSQPGPQGGRGEGTPGWWRLWR